jgi:hypothetical protein
MVAPTSHIRPILNTNDAKDFFDFFRAKVLATRSAIIDKITAIIHENRFSTAGAFVNKYIHWKRMNDLDQRTEKIFKIVISEVYKGLDEAEILPGILMLDIAVKDERVSKQFIQEISLPYVEDLVTTLDLIDRDTLNLLLQIKKPQE